MYRAVCFLQIGVYHKLFLSTNSVYDPVTIDEKFSQSIITLVRRITVASYRGLRTGKVTLHGLLATILFRNGRNIIVSSRLYI